MKFTGDWISVISLSLSTFLTISIFCLSERNSDHADVRAKRQSTVIITSNHTQRIDDAVAEKIRMERKKKPRFTYKDIMNSTSQSAVFSILNTYTSIGTAARIEVIDLELVEKMRGKATRQTWNEYKQFICEYRKSQPERKDAWMDFQWLVAELNHQKLIVQE